MTADATELDFVGPIITRGEIADAAIEAAAIDNPDREIDVEEYSAYIRLQARGEIILNVDTMTEMLGRTFSIGELERNMPGFSGFIRTTEESVRFFANRERKVNTD